MKLRLSAVVALIGLSLTLGLSDIKGQQGPPPVEFVPGEVIVQFDRNVSATGRAAILAQRGGTSLKKYEFLDMERVAVAPGRTVAEAVADFQSSAGVVAASPNFIRRTTQQVPPPNDPSWLNGSLYGMVRISAQPAWTAFGGGSSSVVIANIDTGVDYTHPDLAANIWVNPGEIPGNGIDDDTNGYIDDIHGIDAINNDSNPMDDNGHGSHTAGTSAAVGNNGVGVVGVSWNAKTLICKFLSAGGSGSDGNAIECLNYIVFMKTQRNINIRVTNNSWGGGGFNPSLSNAFLAAGNAGIINMCAAGNGGADNVGDNNDVTPFYPASYTLDSIISVASSNSLDNRANSSNFGVVSVDLAAPGVSILSTFPNNSYGSISGTSMATPHVSGAAAYLAGLDNTLSVASIRQLLLSNVDVLPQWQGVVASGGRLNLFAAAQDVAPAPPATAVFLGSDTNTQGNWPGGYGTDGYRIVGDQTSLPAYATLTPTGHQEFTWAASTSDPRALLRAGQQTRVAATWYSADTFDIDVNITGGVPSRIALYMVDWDTTSRAQQIQVLNAANNAVLDTRNASNFNGGLYLAWNILGNVRFRITRTAGSNAVVSGVFFGAPGNLPPVVALTSPAPGANFNVGQTVPLAANASDPDGTIQSVAFYANGGLLNTDNTAPYEFNWATAPAGPHSLTAVATDNLGAQTTSAAVNITVGGGGGGPTAVFVGSDGSTQGDWSDTYGDDGYLIVGDQTSLPGYATVNPLGNLSWTWEANSVDPRALERVGGGRVAATWYAASAFDVDVTISGGTPRQVALYFVDFDNAGRSQRVDVLNATTLAVLDTRTLGSFAGGQYLVWDVQGNVKFRITRLAGANAVLSGLFFGGGAPPPPPPGADVDFIGTDTGTLGNWQGAFGADGHSIVSDTTNLPGYAQVAPVGHSTWVWDPAPVDVRALQRSGGGRVAATWYGETFDVNVDLSGGQPHEVAIYFVDYDFNSRSQRVDVLDASTLAVLDTRTVNNFTGGVYLVWNVTGNVKFRITRLAGANAVLSGVFLAPPN